MSKHTPAPWRWTKGPFASDADIDIATYSAPGYYDNPHLVGANGDVVFGCDEYDILWGEGETRIANANLLAAAPDLLAALKGIVERGTDSPVHQAAEAAIAKAEGK